MSDVVGPVTLEGWTEAIRGLRQMSSSAARELTRELREAAGIVSTAARDEAAARGLAPPGRSGRGTGQLIARLSVFSTQKAAGVRDTAQHGGYRYARRIEFEHGGSRGFLYPAADRTASQVEARIDDLFDRLRSDAGLGRGGIL